MATLREKLEDLLKGADLTEDDSSVTLPADWIKTDLKPAILQILQEVRLETVETDVETVPLIETVLRQDGTVPVKLISPGWGTSGYYSPEVLKRDGPSVFKKGTKMYWNHPTITEQRERPEGDLRSLAAELVSPARWEDQHPKGPGLYSEAKVFKPFQEAITDLADHIGVSIRGKGKARLGEVEGRKGYLIEQIGPARSVDFVTLAGAGGEIVKLFESYREENSVNGGNMSNEIEDTLDVSKYEEQIAKLKARLSVTEATRIGQEALLKLEGLPVAARSRVLKESVQSLPLTEAGELDVKAFNTQLLEKAKTELEYLSEVHKKGDIVDMGSTGGRSESATEDQVKALAEEFQRIGLSANLAEAAAKGR